MAGSASTARIAVIQSAPSGSNFCSLVKQTSCNKKGAFEGRLFIFHDGSVRYHVSVPWQPGLQVVPLKFMALLVVAEAVASEIGAVSEVKWTAASFVMS